MTKANSNLHAAKKAKNDEFYTLLSDIEKELENYKNLFKNKIIYCNCDISGTGSEDTDSKFYRHFLLKFESYGLKKLICTNYIEGGHGSVSIWEAGEDGSKKMVLEGAPLSSEGDYKDPEVLPYLAECDIVVTNPPFSIFREYVNLLVSFGKSFLLVGNKNAITYKEIFPLIRNNEMWLGNNLVNNFVTPTGKGTSPSLWYTNLPHNRRNEELTLCKEYSEDLYPQYDNYNAIEVKKVVDIPMDYKGIMGVPITFLTKYNPNQFEIVGCSYSYGDEDVLKEGCTKHGCSIDGVSVYKRLFVKSK